MAQTLVSMDQFLRLSKRLDEFAQRVNDEVVLKVFPVGSLFLTLYEENPVEYLGGQWERYAQGCCLVGVDPNDADFSKAGKKVGTKTVSLTEAQNGTHTHGQNAHNHSQNSHSHACTEIFHDYVGGGSTYTWLNRNISTTVANPFGVSAATATNNPATAVNQPSGSGASHNNIQPSIPVFIWVRVA